MNLETLRRAILITAPRASVVRNVIADVAKFEGLFICRLDYNVVVIRYFHIYRLFLYYVRFTS